MIDMIRQFKGEYAFLNNFYEISVEYRGRIYSNNEAAFQAQKTCDERIKQQFENLDPIEARNLGKTIPLRKDWEEVKDQIMYEICFAKFSQHPDLMDNIVYTGKRPLEEGNHWNDRYWGTVNGVGENKLGKILMQIRNDEQIRRDKNYGKGS